jgi:hypothetical protein
LLGAGKHPKQRIAFGHEFGALFLHCLETVARRGFGRGSFDPAFLRQIGFRAQSLECGRGLRDSGVSLSNCQRICGSGSRSFPLCFCFGLAPQQPFLPLHQLGDATVERGLPRLIGRDLAHQFAQLMIQPVDKPAALIELICRKSERLALARRRRFEPFPFGNEPLDRLSGLALVFAFAFEIGANLRKAFNRFGSRLPNPGFLRIQRRPRVVEPLQFGRRFGLGVAQGRERGAGISLPRRGGGNCLGAFGNCAFGRVERRTSFFNLTQRVLPLQVDQKRFGATDMIIEIPVSVGLPRLLLQGLKLAFERDDDVIKPGQIALSRAQPKLRLVPARMQPRDPGGFLE